MRRIQTKVRQSEHTRPRHKRAIWGNVVCWFFNSHSGFLSFFFSAACCLFACFFLGCQWNIFARQSFLLSSSFFDGLSSSFCRLSRERWFSKRGTLSREVNVWRERKRMKAEVECEISSGSSRLSEVEDFRFVQANWKEENSVDDSPVTSHIALSTKINSRYEAKTLDVLSVRLILNFFIQCWKSENGRREKERW